MIAIEKYRPSGSEERACFFDGWCCECARDKAMRDGKDIDECDDSEVCPIVGRIFLPIDDPEYPAELRYDGASEPCCTAFVPAGEEVPAPRCEWTADLFGGGVS
jgi:hypothetical protein